MPRTYNIALLALFTACTIATAEGPGHAVRAPPSQVVSWDGLDRDELTRADVRGTARSIALTLQDIEALTPERRAAVTESYRVLSVNCPYTRASMMLPLALHAEVMGIDAHGLHPLVQRDWANLQRGLTAHVAVVAALGGDLASPEPGDHLFGAGPELLADRHALLASPDPIGRTWPLVRAISFLVNGLDGPTTERIELARQEVDKAVGQATMGLHLGGWENALRKIEPFVDDDVVRGRIQRMIEVSSHWGSQGC